MNFSLVPNKIVSNVYKFSKIQGVKVPMLIFTPRAKIFNRSTSAKIDPKHGIIDSRSVSIISLTTIYRSLLYAPNSVPV
jgi:hypothetical protein